MIWSDNDFVMLKMPNLYVMIMLSRVLLLCRRQLCDATVTFFAQRTRAAGRVILCATL